MIPHPLDKTMEDGEKEQAGFACTKESSPLASTIPLTFELLKSQPSLPCPEIAINGQAKEPGGVLHAAPPGPEFSRLPPYEASLAAHSEPRHKEARAARKQAKKAWREKEKLKVEEKVLDDGRIDYSDEDVKVDQGGRMVRRRKRIKAEVEFQFDEDDEDLVLVGDEVGVVDGGRDERLWQRNGEVEFDLGEDARFKDDEVQWFGGRDEIETEWVLGTEAMPRHWQGFDEPREEKIGSFSMPGVQEFGIAQSREDDFNSSWFREEQAREIRKRDVPDGLVQLARARTSIEDEESVGATKYQVDEEHHMSMRRALLGVKAETVPRDDMGETRREQEGDSVTKSLKEVEKIHEFTEKWMAKSEPAPKKRRVRTVKTV